MASNGTIFQSDTLHISFDVNSLTNNGDHTPLVGISVGYILGRKVGVQKVTGYAPKNQYQIRMAQRAKELGLEVEVPEAIPHDHDYEEEEMEDVIEEYKENFSYRFTYGEHAEQKSYFVRTKDGRVQCWKLYESWDSCGLQGWGDHLDAKIRSLVPEKIAAFCDRMVAYLATEEARYREELRDEERERLRKELNLS